MRLISLSLKNYRKYQEEEVDFPDGLVGIIGPNGAGKSTLMEAVSWVLYGNQAVRTGKEGIKRQGTSPADLVEVTLDLEFGGENYKIIREMRPARGGISDAAIYANKNSIARGVKATQEYIHKMLGLTREAFFTSFFAKQKELNYLSELIPAERKTLILKMLGISRIDEAKEELKKNLRDLTTEINTLRMTLADPKVIQKNLGQKEKEIEKGKLLLADRNKRKEKAEKKLSRFKEALLKEERRKEEHARLSEEYKITLASLKEKKESLKNQEEEYQHLRKVEGESKKKALEVKGLIKLEKEKEVLREERTMVSSQISQAQEEHKKLLLNEEKISISGPESECPTCLRPLGKDFGKIKNHLRKEAQRLEEDIASQKNKVVHLKKEEKLKEDQVSYLRKKQEEIFKIEGRLKRLPLILEQTKNLSKEIQEKAKLLEEIKQKGTALKFSLSQYEELKKANELAQEKLAQAKESVQAASHQIELLKLELKNLQKELQDFKIKKDRIKELARSKENLETLSELFDSFRKYLIGKVRPVLAAKSSSLLSELTEGKYEEMELDEDYETFLYDQGERFPLERFSGGEKDLVNFCLRLSISELMTEAHQTEFGFIILDEIFGSQDALRKENIMRALTKLSGRFRQIFLITHVEEVKDFLEYALTVAEDESGISHLTLE